MSQNSSLANSTTNSTVGPPDEGVLPFTCTCSDGGLGAAWVHLTGALDLTTAARLERTLEDAQRHTRLIVLDLRDLAFADDAGVRVIVEATRRAWRRGHRLVLVRGPAQVDIVFAVTRSSDNVEIFDLTRAEPPLQVLLRLAEKPALAMSLASSRGLRKTA